MDFSEFIETYRNRLKTVFRTEDNINELSLKRGIPSDILRQVMDCKPLSTFIPSEYGGRGCKTHEALSMLEASSYESLALSLMMGINGALFLQPLANYGSEEIKQDIFTRFLEDQSMGGLMITEPDYGSDALRMETSYIKDDNSSNYSITGTKHWAGLTGQADYWLITARMDKQNGSGLGRDIGFFVHDSRNGGIEVEEYYNNLGLYMLPYGRNKIDITVPEEFKLKPRSTGIKMMLDVLHRSRLQFPGMGMGFLKRLLDEAHKHCKSRLVGGKNLYEYDQVKRRIARLQMAFTVCSAMCTHTSTKVPLKRDASTMDVQANTIKTVTTDLMQEASQSLLQLMGAKGYRLDHIAGRSLIDSRPFQIFEGSNDILYQQIAESVLKKMRRLKLNNMFDFLKKYELTSNVADRFNGLFNFNVDSQMVQHKMVDMGRILSRVISMEFTLRLEEYGFNRNLINNSLRTLEDKVEQLMTTFKNKDTADVVDDYEENSAWVRFVAPELQYD
ncbi:acyl-CoA/acyl-ACP dehydrogenase [Aliifodinibius sp. S!AR15-10]|uniref:acyl-CoA dehydrogenase family protein n=1 Tax=Aliifodinibius sp. S!AR15-10 TaxID=2950437 RepID=UPI002866E8F2|nr:acyl-CoA dehydrogenase family protein [Aliifodinibius sp. S!AR15-10]MDR8392665.1 acyl-CoA/acyl-ACP dehydrogenase [Aliifodinibius sp. S!AR15-10]